MLRFNTFNHNLLTSTLRHQSQVTIRGPRSIQSHDRVLKLSTSLRAAKSRYVVVISGQQESLAAVEPEDTPLSSPAATPLALIIMGTSPVHLSSLTENKESLQKQFDFTPLLVEVEVERLE